jgi:8-oxo-dGTP diphosphatase
MKETTLVLPIRSATNEILLAMKKRGFGVGKLNGMGGKIETRESVRDAAVREVQEEIGITINQDTLVAVVENMFTFENNPDGDIHCYTFFAYEWAGDPVETEEMAPQFFPLGSIPYDRMWIDDQEWLPQALAGKKLRVAFHFTEDGSAILKRDIREVDSLTF